MGREIGVEEAGGVGRDADCRRGLEVGQVPELWKRLDLSWVVWNWVVCVGRWMGVGEGIYCVESQSVEGTEMNCGKLVDHTGEDGRRSRSRESRRGEEVKGTGKEEGGGGKSWIQESSLAVKFCDQPNVITVKASDMHQAKRSEELFRVVEGGVGGTFGLVDAGFKSTKLSKKMRTGDGIGERRSHSIPTTSKNGKNQLQGGVYMKKFTM